MFDTTGHRRQLRARVAAHDAAIPDEGLGKPPRLLGLEMAKHSFDE